MFDQALGTATTSPAQIVVTLHAGVPVAALALLDVDAGTVQVQAPGYDQTQAVVPGAAVTFLALASAGYAGFSIAMAGVRFAGDRAVASLGARRVVVGGSALAGAGLLLAVLVPAPLAASVGFALVGLGLGNVAPVAFSAAARAGTTPASGIAPVATVGYAGFLLGPPIIGALSGVVGLRGALGCLVLATAVVALVGSRVSERR